MASRTRTGSFRVKSRTGLQLLDLTIKGWEDEIKHAHRTGRPVKSANRRLRQLKAERVLAERRVLAARTQ